VKGDVAFTGERLHAGDALFAVDLARHEAAYRLARGHCGQGRVLDLGCGSGYGTAALAREHARVVGLDRIRPDAGARGRAHFVRADLRGIPLAPGSFELVVSFQVIEHLEDPSFYLAAIAALLAPGGTALITTPNVLTSDGVNPYHVHEYAAGELEQTLRRHFDEVELRGVGANESVRAYLAARSARIRRIMRLDPLGLRRLLPRAALEWLFARFALLVRRRTGGDEGAPDADWRDFPVGPADARCLDLLAVCRQPRRSAQEV
jgi:SAM-dependent methyltransferase